MNFHDEWELTSDYEPASREYIGGLNTFASFEAGAGTDCFNPAEGASYPAY